MELLAVIYIACGLFTMLAFSVIFLKVLSSLIESFAETNGMEKLCMVFVLAISIAIIWFAYNTIPWSSCHASTL